MNFTSSSEENYFSICNYKQAFVYSGISKYLSEVDNVNTVQLLNCVCVCGFVVFQELFCIYSFIYLIFFFASSFSACFFFFFVQLELHYCSDLDPPRSGACSANVD